MSENLSKEDVKRVLKEVHKEWLDDHFAAFGRWTFLAIAGMAFVAFIQFLVWLRSPERNEASIRVERPRIEGSR
jgi:hypothetical protein